jgi:hypothetical protein
MTVDYFQYYTASLFYFILFYFILFYFILFYFILFYLFTAVLCHYGTVRKVLGLKVVYCH